MFCELLASFPEDLSPPLGCRRQQLLLVPLKLVLLLCGLFFLPLPSSPIPQFHFLTLERKETRIEGERIGKSLLFLT